MLPMLPTPSEILAGRDPGSRALGHSWPRNVPFQLWKDPPSWSAGDPLQLQVGRKKQQFRGRNIGQQLQRRPPKWLTVPQSVASKCVAAVAEFAPKRGTRADPLKIPFQLQNRTVFGPKLARFRCRFCAPPVGDLCLNPKKPTETSAEVPRFPLKSIFFAKKSFSAVKSRI